MTSSSAAPGPGTRLRTLRGLAGYRCGHAGSCCRAGWPIPIEAVPLALLRRADVDGVLPHTEGSWQDDGILGRTPDNSCVFHERDARQGCRLEASLGPTALPTACRQFPRVLLADASGWHQTLSAWCVTAAGLIVQGSPDFLSFDHISADPRVHTEGLDARQAWPPLLRPGVLAGTDGYAAWESLMLQRYLAPVSTRGFSLGTALLDALAWTNRTRVWRPTDGPLVNHLVSAGTAQSTTPRVRDVSDVLIDLISGVPGDWRPGDWPAGLTDVDRAGAPVSRGCAERALARYLGVRLAGSWVAYQGEGVRSVAASLVSTYVLATLALDRLGEGPVTIGRLTSAIRAVDWLQLHLLDRHVWAAWCSQWERRPDDDLAGLVAGGAAVLDSLVWSDRRRQPISPT